MSSAHSFHFVTVGWPPVLINGLCAEITARGGASFTHIAHPRYSANDWPKTSASQRIRYFREMPLPSLPPSDPEILASLEQEGVPTIHNMILGDRVVRRLHHDEALRYATFISKRLFALFSEMRPSVVVGAFDSLHGGLALAVAKRMGIPWFAMHFSVIPPGFACFCDRLSPAARVDLGVRSRPELLALAESTLQRFEERNLQAYAYAPPYRSLARALARFPARLSALLRILRKSSDREFAKFVEVETRYDAIAALLQIWRSRQAQKALAGAVTAIAPPATPYVLFGLHMQPESSIDVWAPFYSNQMWVIELLSRSIPPSHKLLVKIHKSDVSNYSRESLDRMRSFPGVELVRPSADARSLIEQADLVVAIQGTMGLEAALLGKPVVMLGDSPVTRFPSASSIGEIHELPALIRRKLVEPRATREQILDAYAAYLAPFSPAGHNNWLRELSDKEIAGFIRLFDRLEHYVVSGTADRELPK